MFYDCAKARLRTKKSEIGKKNTNISFIALPHSAQLIHPIRTAPSATLIGVNEASDSASIICEEKVSSPRACDFPPAGRVLHAVFRGSRLKQ